MRQKAISQLSLHKNWWWFLIASFNHIANLGLDLVLTGNFAEIIFIPEVCTIYRGEKNYYRNSECMFRYSP